MRTDCCVVLFVAVLAALLVCADGMVVKQPNHHQQQQGQLDAFEHNGAEQQQQQQVGGTNSASLLVGLEAKSSLQAQPHLNALAISPLQNLVSEMKATMIQDTLDTITADDALDIEEKGELGQYKSQLSQLTTQLSFHTSALAVVQSHKNQTQRALTEQELFVAQLEQSLATHSNSCLADAPGLAAEVDAVSRDLHILNMLKTRIQQLASDPKAMSLFSAMLSQVSTKMSSHQTLSAMNQLLELDSGADTEQSSPNNNNDNNNNNNNTPPVALVASTEKLDVAVPDTPEARFQRMQQLLNRLISEVQGVLDDTLAQVSALSASCASQESEMRANLTQHQTAVEGLSSSLTTYLKQEQTESEAAKAIQTQIDKVSAELAVVQARVNDRSEIFLSLIRRRQNAVSILVQMDNVLQKYSSQLENMNLKVVG